MVDIHSARTALYRLYGTDDQLLYVGITNMPQVRWAAHCMKPWWSQVVRKQIDWFGSRQEAAEAEVRAIRAESPAHNRMHAVSRNGEPSVAPIEIADSGDFDAALKAAADEWRRAKAGVQEADAELRALLIEGRAVGKGPSHMAKLTGFTREWVAKIAPEPKSS